MIFYKEKLGFLKLLNTPAGGRLYHGLRRVVHPQPAKAEPADQRAELIKKMVPGKSFADIGSMWGINGYYAFLAEESGARTVTAVDVYPESAEFLNEKAKRNSAIKFVQGDIHSRDTIEKIGVCDVVLCFGVLYHSPSPFDLLMRLRMICGQTFILGTALIPEMEGLQNVAVFWPFLSVAQRNLWDLGGGLRMGLSGPYEPESGYGNWFWGLTPTCVEALLECTGFKIEERSVGPFGGTFVCQTALVKFEPVSGRWTTP